MKAIMLFLTVFGILFAEPNIPNIIVDARQLLKALAYDEQQDPPNIYDWSLPQSSRRMIAWDPEASKWENDGFKRAGIILLSNKGKLTHHRIDQEVKPGYWTLRLFANTSVPTRVTLTPSDITQENPHIDLDVVNIEEKVVCRDERTVKQTGYRMKFPGKKAFWMDEVTQISSKGSISSYRITYGQKPECVIKKLREEEQARQLEAQKRQEEAALEKKRREIEKLRRKKEALEKIRQANEELKREQIEQIKQVKKELEGLLDQKIDLQNMLGAQNAFNYQQSLKLIQNKIAYIKKQKQIAAKIKGVKSNIDLLSKELEMAQQSLKKLKNSQKDRTKAAFLKKRAQMQKKLLARSRQLLESYQEEKQISETKEMIGQRLAKDASTNTYVVKQTNISQSALIQQEKKYKLLRQTVLEKLQKAQQKLLVDKEEVTKAEAAATSTADEANSTMVSQRRDTLEIKNKIVKQTEDLIVSYKNKQAEYERMLTQIELTKKTLEKSSPKQASEEDTSSVYHESTSSGYSPSPSSSSGSFETFLREYLASGTGRITRDIVARYFARQVRPYYSIANADREDVYRDKVRYAKRWPQRNYWLKDYHVIDRYSMGGRDYIEVLMTLGWRVYSSKRGEKSGDSTVSMTLDVTGEHRLITALRSVKMHHNIPDRTFRSSSHDHKEDQRSLRIQDDGVAIEVRYPGVVHVGKVFTLTARMTNRSGRTARQGGLTLSFPDMTRLSGTVKRGTFYSVQGYSYPDLIYSNITHGKIVAEYFMVEGWHKYRWHRGETKSFTVALRAPEKISQLRINVRGILWIRNKYDTRQAPRNALVRDQQGFNVRQFVINVR